MNLRATLQAGLHLFDIYAGLTTAEGRELMS
jgi:hypothetical protein